MNIFLFLSFSLATLLTCAHKRKCLDHLLLAFFSHLWSCSTTRIPVRTRLVAAQPVPCPVSFPVHSLPTKRSPTAVDGPFRWERFVAKIGLSVVVHWKKNFRVRIVAPGVFFIHFFKVNSFVAVFIAILTRFFSRYFCASYLWNWIHWTGFDYSWICWLIFHFSCGELLMRTVQAHLILINFEISGINWFFVWFFA